MPTRTQSTVVAVFKTSEDAQAALNDLRSSGFRSSDLYLSNSDAFGSDIPEAERTARHEGGIGGWFKSIFGGEHNDASYYEEAAGSGNVVLSATVSDDQIDRVAGILEQHSPIDLHREAEDVYEDTSATGRSPIAGSMGSSAAAAATTAGATAAAAGRAANVPAGQRGTETAIPVVREELQVGKRTVLRGGVRVYSRMVEEPVEEQVRLRDEHVRVSRTPVNREATAADLRPGQEQVFEVKEYTEEPVVAKTARVVEEVRVGKDATERTETIRDSVRHTEIEVDNLAEAQTGRATSGATTTAGYTGTAATTNFDQDYRADFQKNYASAGGRYDDYAPAYQYGYKAASDPRFKGKSWNEIESNLRQDYGNQYPNSTWERMKNAVRYGWDRVKAKV